VVNGIPEAVDKAPPVVSAPSASAAPTRGRALDYAVLLKPRVMSLVVFTGLVGLLLAPGQIPLLTAVAAIVCMAVGAGAAGAINMWYDRDIDRFMRRTQGRPIPAGRMPPGRALAFGVVLSVGSVLVMALMVNPAAAFLLALTIVYYVFVYTMWLKRRTPQNIVIGGASGAFPPVIGWVAVTGDVGLGALALFLIIFMWTPPHFWALALFCQGDYEKAGVPMLPVVAGVRETKRQILVYTVLLIPVTLLPVAAEMSGWLYGVAALALGGWLLRHAIAVWRDDSGKAGRPMFLFSILYLFLVFVFLLLDRALSTFV
jgi:protoheme IX farnesyltransferase